MAKDGRDGFVPLRGTSKQSTVESHTRAFHADSSYQAAGLEQHSDQSTCEIQPSMSRAQSAFENEQWQAKRTRLTTKDQKAGQLSDVKTKLMVIRQKVDRNRARWIRLRCEYLSRRTILLASEERGGRQAAGRPQQGRDRESHLRSNQRLRVIPLGVREGSDGTLSSRMSSPIEQVREVNRSNSQYTAEEDESWRT